MMIQQMLPPQKLLLLHIIKYLRDLFAAFTAHSKIFPARKNVQITAALSIDVKYFGGSKPPPYDRTFDSARRGGCPHRPAKDANHHRTFDRTRRVDVCLRQSPSRFCRRRMPIFHNILCFVENLTTTREKNLEKSAFCGNFYLTFADKLVYNTTLSGCMCVFAYIYSTTLID